MSGTVTVHLGDLVVWVRSRVEACVRDLGLTLDGASADTVTSVVREARGRSRRPDDDDRTGRDQLRRPVSRSF